MRTEALHELPCACQRASHAAEFPAVATDLSLHRHVRRDDGTRAIQKPAGNRQHGFTLLEVMVALTIAGLALGGLFAVIAGNKQLAWRSEGALLKSTQVRSLINFSQLNDQHGEVFIDFDNQDLRLVTDIELEVPARKTQGSRQGLRGYEVLDENGEVVASGTYWVELDLAE